MHGERLGRDRGGIVIVSGRGGGAGSLSCVSVCKSGIVEGIVRGTVI